MLTRNGGYSHAADQLGDAKEFAITPDFHGDLGRITDDKTVRGQGYAIVPSKAQQAQRLRPFQRLPPIPNRVQGLLPAERSRTIGLLMDN